MNKPAVSESCCVAVRHLSYLVNALKAKFQLVRNPACDSNQSVIVVPSSWSVRKTCKFFERLQYAVQRAGVMLPADRILGSVRRLVAKASLQNIH